MTKSFVTMAQTICPICGEREETGELLIDKSCKKKFDRLTPVGFKDCKKCSDLIKQDYVACLEITNEEVSKDTQGIGKIKEQDAKRTGRYLFISKDTLGELIPHTKEVDDLQGRIFVDPESFDLMIDLYKKSIN